MSTFFLFNGGNYKRNLDDGRIRVPLTTSEAEQVFFDPALTGQVDGNSHRTELALNAYSDYLSSLAVGDEIFVAVFPDAAVYRGLWMGSYSALAGMTADAELVSVTDVCDAYVANDGDASGVAAFAGTPTISYDFGNGMMNSTKDAEQQACLYDGDASDFRNNDALVYEGIIPPVPALLGQALYLRLTITAVPATLGDGGCCGSCGEGQLPIFAAGIIADEICFDKQKITNTCNCPETLGDCNTCTDSK